mgnify:FL=1
MALLSCALRGEAVENILTKCETPEWPDGLACLVMAELKERCHPDDIDTAANLQDDMASVRMKPKDDPSKMLDTLEGIQARYKLLGKDVPEEDLVARALVVAPSLYSGVLISEQCHKGTAFTLKDIRKVMKKTYQITYGDAAKKNEKKEDDGKEVSLYQVQGSGGFKGSCFLCKKIGHKASECSKSKGKSHYGDSNEKQSVTCGHCGKKGHPEDKCWLKPGNDVPESKAMQALKMLQKQVQAVFIDGGGKDIQLCQVDTHGDGS